MHLRQEEIYQRQALRALRAWLLLCLSFFYWWGRHAPAPCDVGPSPLDWGWHCGLSPTLTLPECFWRLHLISLERFHWANLSPFAQNYQAFKLPLSSKLRRLAESSAEFNSEVFWNIKQLTCLSSCWAKFQKKPREYSGYFLTINLTSSDFS